MILFKPCPPCCPTTPAGFPDILVPNDFWTFNKGRKLDILQTVSANRADLVETLDEFIGTLKSGTDLVQGS